jgi:hypothetical protein
MLADFEQVVDTVEWLFIGQACVKWINYFNTNIPSAVINNYHLSYVFLLEVVRQLILFHLTFSSMCWNFWGQPIAWSTGIWCNNKWIWISTKSICRLFRIDFRGWPTFSWINLYYIRLLLSLCLTAISLDKTEVNWDCSRLGRHTQMLPEKTHLAWNTSEKFILMGIHLNLYKKENTFEYFR